MAQDATTIARPYAEAVFERAEERKSLDAWSEMLAFLAETVQDPGLADFIGNPLLERQRLEELMLDIGADRLNEEGRNLVRLLVDNDRLPVLPEIAVLYEQLKAESQRVLNVHLRSAYPLQAEQEQRIAEVLKLKLGRDVTLTTEQDPDLIGGVHIRAGDLVIDGSVRGKLQQLANELGI